MTALYQLRFQGRGELPTAREIEQWGRRWIDTGKAPEGVAIDVLEWTTPERSSEEVRRALRGNAGVFFGCPGVVKEYSAMNRTFCDYDTPAAPDAGRFFELSRMVGNPLAFLRYDRTRRGWHVVAEWGRPLSNLVEIVAFQVILGSDVMRERFNLVRALSGRRSNRWNLLFERKL